MNVTFRQLQVFDAVARNLSYTRAAQELFLTQPAVSMQIRQLEDSVGLPLFEQIGKKIFLTQAGNEMRRYASAIAAQLDEAEDVIDELKGVSRGHLTLAVASTANAFATQLLSAFNKAYETVTLSLEVTNRKRLLEILGKNEKDMVIMGQPPESMALRSDSFMENPLVVIAAADHPLAKKKKIAINDLMSETFVIREQGSGTRIAMERFFSEHEVSIGSGLEMSSNEAIKQSVAASLGLGIVSIHTLDLELAAKRLVILDVEHFPILRKWYLVHPEGKRLSPTARAFHEFVLKNASKIWTQPGSIN